MRRTSIRLAAIVAILLLAAPLTPAAQPAGKMHRIGYLAPGGPSPLVDAFRQRLRELGYVEGQNLSIEYRHSGGQFERLAPLARELAGLGVDVLVAWSPMGALAAKRATSQIPVVFLAAGDVVGSGLVSTLARPGGNVTGVSFDATLETYAKGLEFLKEAVPSLTRVTRLLASEPASPAGTRTLYAGAWALGLELHDVEVRAPAELEAAVRTAKAQGTQALYIVPSGFTRTFGKELAELALANRLPSFHPFAENAIAGGLFSYAPSLAEIARHGAVYVDRILKGSKPADLPVEQPTKFEFVINLKTARALGLTIPESLLLRADQIIQ